MRRVRLIHYNVQGCTGGFDALLEQIRAEQPDVVCVNEVRKVQAKAFARALGKQMRWSGGWGHRIANAVLAPSIEASRVIKLPRTKGLARRSAVVVRWAGVDWMSTHLSLDAGERARHAPLLLAAVSGSAVSGAAVVAADMNERPDGPTWAAFREQFADTGPDVFTFPTTAPRIRIDTVWRAPSIEALGARALDGGVSDHLGIAVDLRIADP